MADDGGNGDKSVVIPINQYVQEKVEGVERRLQTQLDAGNRIVLEEISHLEEKVTTQISHLEEKVTQEVSHLKRYQGLMTLVYGAIVVVAIGIGSLVVYNTSNVYKIQTEAIQQQTEAYKKNSDAHLELIREKLGLQDKKIEFYLEKSCEGSKSK